MKNDLQNHLERIRECFDTSVCRISNIEISKYTADPLNIFCYPPLNSYERIIKGQVVPKFDIKNIVWIYEDFSQFYMSNNLKMVLCTFCQAIECVFELLNAYLTNLYALIVNTIAIDQWMFIAKMQLG